MPEGSPYLIGIVVQTVLFVLTAYAMIVRTEANTKALQKEVEAIHEGLKAQIGEMQKEIKGMAELMIKLAVQTTRLDLLSDRVNTLDNRVEDMRHGRGYIDRDNRRGVSGEY